MPYVTDTHPLLRHLTRNKRLSARAAALFEAADRGRQVIYVPTIVLGELMYISEAGQASVSFADIINRMKPGDNYLVAPLDLPVIEAAYEIGLRLEMHDRIVLATGKVMRVPVITVDEKMVDVGVVATVG